MSLQTVRKEKAKTPRSHYISRRSKQRKGKDEKEESLNRNLRKVRKGGKDEKESLDLGTKIYKGRETIRNR